MRVSKVRSQIRREESRIVVVESDLPPVHSLVPSEIDVLAESEEIRFADGRAVGVHASAAAGLRLRRDRPRVLRDDANVDDAIVRRGRSHGRGLQKSERAKIALRLRQTLRLVDITLAKEKKLLDDMLPRLDVEAIGEAIEPAGLLLARGIDVQRLDGDLSDVQW